MSDVGKRIIDGLRDFDAANWPEIPGTQCEICGSPAQCKRLRRMGNPPIVATIWLCQACHRESDGR